MNMSVKFNYGDLIIYLNNSYIREFLIAPNYIT